jgi:hypothetical protein
VCGARVSSVKLTAILVAIARPIRRALIGSPEIGIVRAVMTRPAQRMLSLLALVTLPLVGCEEAGGPVDVYNLEPRHGQTAGEQAVRISGANFRQDIGYAVYFGSERATQVTIMDTSTLLVATPQHDLGTVDVVVASEAGPAFRLHDAFAFDDTGGTEADHAGSSAGGAERY